MNTFTILLAEDQEENRRRLADQLRNVKLQVIEFEDGQAALEAVRAGQRFDVLVTDYQMPRLNGGELVDALRNDGHKQPMIIWTALLHPPDCPGASRIVSKMSGLPTIVETVNQFLASQP